MAFTGCVLLMLQARTTDTALRQKSLSRGGRRLAASVPLGLLILVGTVSHPAAASGSWPAWLLAFPEPMDAVLVADTSSATLYRYYRSDAGELLAEPHYMSIGRNGVGKRRAGDRLTPIGVYFVTEQLDTRGLNEKYGITAFPIDYPNTIDRRLGRTGDGIWIHGVTPGGGQRPVRDTDGCIALPNEQLAELAPRLKPGTTPVIIVREMAYASREDNEALAAELKRALERWRSAQVEGDLQSYFASYGEDFEYRGLSRDDWQNLRLARADGSTYTELEIHRLIALAEPGDNTLFVTRFDLRGIRGNGQPLKISKRLYWRRDSGGDFVIVAEDNG